MSDPELQPVGFYPELGRPVHDQQSLLSLRSDAPRPDEERLLDHLRSGIPVLDVMSAELDVIDHREYVTGAKTLVTDGRWIWRLELPYYVHKYHIQLPEDFVVDALRGSNPIDPDLLPALSRAALRFF